VLTDLRLDYITSDNAMMSVELGKTADMLESIGGGGSGDLGSLATTLRHYEGTIRDAIWAHTLNADGIFAYETNGYGGMYIMDDANVPSLAGLPYVGFLERNDSSYVKTKEAMFSRENPYYAVGKNFTGIGYVNTRKHAWAYCTIPAGYIYIYI
jgi:meiotically up-regulated gene 157 (Mug157) protein